MSEVLVTVRTRPNTQVGSSFGVETLTSQDSYFGLEHLQDYRAHSNLTVRKQAVTKSFMHMLHGENVHRDAYGSARNWGYYASMFEAGENGVGLRIARRSDVGLPPMPVSLKEATAENKSFYQWAKYHPNEAKFAIEVGSFITFWANMDQPAIADLGVVSAAPLLDAFSTVLAGVALQQS